jgi:hypothetical protein
MIGVSPLLPMQQVHEGVGCVAADCTKNENKTPGTMTQKQNVQEQNARKGGLKTGIQE